MSKLLSKIVIPIVLSGLFSIVVFLGLYYGQLTLEFYIVLLLLVIFIFSFGFSVGRNFVNPLEELIKKVRELSEGNLSTRISLKTKDEFTELANILNKIAEELQESHIDEEMIEKEIEIKTKARTQILQETINALEEKIRNRTIELERLRTESEYMQEELEKKEKQVSQLKKELENLKTRLEQRNNK